jgi:Co/Zn/Cd efflux system component
MSEYVHEDEHEYDFHHLDHVKKQSKTKKTLWIVLFLTLFFTIVEISGAIFGHKTSQCAVYVWLFEI